MRRVASRIGEFRCRSFPSQIRACYSAKIISTAFELVGFVIVDNQTSIATCIRSVYVMLKQRVLGVSYYVYFPFIKTTYLSVLDEVFEVFAVISNLSFYCVNFPFLFNCVL